MKEEESKLRLRGILSIKKLKLREGGMVPITMCYQLLALRKKSSLNRRDYSTTTYTHSRFANYRWVSTQLPTQRFGLDSSYNQHSKGENKYDLHAYYYCPCLTSSSGLRTRELRRTTNKIILFSLRRCHLLLMKSVCLKGLDLRKVANVFDFLDLELGPTSTVRSIECAQNF